MPEYHFPLVMLWFLCEGTHKTYFSFPDDNFGSRQKMYAAGNDARKENRIAPRPCTQFAYNVYYVKLDA
jgi:hypothetical protein